MTKKQAIAVDVRALDELVPYERNTRKHSPVAIQKLARIIGELGWTTPILLDGDDIVAGHKRRLAAQLIYADGGRIRTPGGVELPDGTVPCIDVTGWSEEQRRAYIIADNQTTLDSEWDGEMLRLELAWLDDAGTDMTLTGFDGAQLTRHLIGDGKEGNTDPDDTPEPEEVPVTRAGDVWQMGDHVLICGDSTDPDVVSRLLGDEHPHLMVTDPPYGVEYDASFRNGIRRANGTIVSARAVGKVMNDDRADWSEAWALFPGDVAYVWHAGVFAGVVADSLTGCGFNLRSQIIWAKSNFAIGRGDYHWQHEPCWYAVRDGKKGHYTGDRKQTTLWQIPKPQKSETGHSTQKPVECMKRPILNNSDAGDAIYEPFNGSGTTIIAAEMTGRRCFAVELNPAYVDVAVRRWEAFTGLEAILIETGGTFSEVTEQRLG